ncbi:inovirus Gp2 family protein [Paenalcaligenes sp. Me131]|uniref:inovirus Gp2 family protein n=1 Tax=Paenalcaligenes sp. Me131 TaxID=3392636 RepID=UPI003D2C95C8
MNTHPAHSYNKSYQKQIIRTLWSALKAHKRITAVRVDLRTSSDHSNQPYPSALMTRFIESLKAKLAVDLERKSTQWNRQLACQLKYAWVREVGPINKKKHFHVLLLLNKDVYHALGDFRQDRNTLASMIAQAWCSALSVPYPEHKTLTHFPFGGLMYVDANHPTFEQQRRLVLARANYLAKKATKQYGDGERSFGCSRS